MDVEKKWAPIRARENCTEAEMAETLSDDKSEKTRAGVYLAQTNKILQQESAPLNKMKDKRLTNR